MHKIASFVAFVCLSLVSCAPQTKLSQNNLSKHPVVLVVSFDGFRYDYLEKTDTPNLKALRDEGVSVPFMEAQFPTKTFPNHQTMATGLYPSVHGITDNTVYDPDHGQLLSGFNDDPAFWNFHPDVYPFWIRNEQAGDERYSGTFLWSGSSTGYGENFNLYPTYYLPKYDEAIPWETRVSTVISWLTHEVKPANVVYLYHNEPDSHGHFYGTDDEATLAEIRRVDDRAGYLIQELKTAGIYDLINIVIVSDHGMKSVSIDDVIDTRPMLDQDLYVRYGGTPVYHILPKDTTNLESIYAAFKQEAENKNFSAYKNSELAHLNFGENRRIMPIILIADPGFVFEDQNFRNPENVSGVHGYDNNSESMRALFIARGPNFKQNYKSESPVRNLDLVPLFSKIMGIAEPPNNGTIQSIEHILAQPETDKDSGGLRIFGSIFFLPFITSMIIVIKL